MLCEHCHQNPATVHFTQVLNGEKKEQYLCEECAQKLNVAHFGDLSFNTMLANLFAPAGAAARTETRCPVCGASYADFAEGGLLGCPGCYDTFRSRIEPILRRVHNAVTHQGKLPVRGGGDLSTQRRIEELRLQLTQLVMREDFEEAARVRDEIRALEEKGGAPHADH